MIGALEDPLADYCARRDIGDALARYMRGLDRLDEALFRSAFHRDAQIDCGVYAGDLDGFATFAFGFLGQMQASHHMLGQCRIAIHDAGHARGECYFQAWHGVTGAQGEARDLFIAGRYVDEYACRAGQWRIARRTLVSDWATDTPASGVAYMNGPQTIRSGRGGTDPSDRPAQT
ncbi:nuclear transport factor 2 family protein [Sphingomonas sp. R3G8C]|uniref:nuclear transport factor 2 family protein n=1 Tax=Novosphingobium rhizosphaerae TaxID=1551649 RepID=UPI0015C70872